MAIEVVKGLLEELGLGNIDENAAFQRGAGQTFQGGGNVGDFMQLGQSLGRQIGPGVQGLLSAATNRKNGKGFGANFAQGTQDLKDAVIARGMGTDVDTLRRNRASRQAMSGIQVAPSGDPIKDQMAALDQVVAIATRNGDSDLAFKARAKQLQIKSQANAMRSAELGVAGEEREEREGLETDSVGRSVRLIGDDESGELSKAVMNEDGTWTVVRPDGSIKENVPGIQLRWPTANDTRATPRDRQFETPIGAMKATIDLNGLGGQGVDKRRTYLGDMAEQANVVKDMTDGLNSMFDPKVAFADSGVAANIADRSISFVETIASLFTRKGDKESEVTYNDKKVSRELQYKEGTKTDHLTSYLAKKGMTVRDILPEHIQADTKEAQKFMANVMQLAYLDARLQEPSNRGLSDTDIENALARIGVHSPNPMVFAEKQLENLARLESKIGNLGVEFSGTEYIDQYGQKRGVSKQDFINHVYPPEMVAPVLAAIHSSQDSLLAFMGKSQGPQDPTAPAPELSDDEFLDSF